MKYNVLTEYVCTNQGILSRLHCISNSSCTYLCTYVASSILWYLLVCIPSTFLYTSLERALFMVVPLLPPDCIHQEELAVAQCQVGLLQCQLLYERYKCQQHIQRNRRLRSTASRAGALSEEVTALVGPTSWDICCQLFTGHLVWSGTL